MTAKTKPLKLWNGRLYHDGRQGHCYVAAYSVADARRLFVELGLRDPGATEIRQFWNAGYWGNPMRGVTPERGVWISKSYGDKPERYLGARS